MKLKITCLIFAIILSVFVVSCNKSGEKEETTETGAVTETEPSAAVTEKPESSNINTRADEEMRSGLVYSQFVTDDWAERVNPLAEWYAGNYIAGDAELDSISYISSRVYPYFEEITLNSAVYLARYGDYDSYFSILYGSTKDIDDTYYLIDGKRTDDYINFADSWEKVKAHKITGEVAGELKQPVFTGDFTILNAAGIIGEDSEIVYTFSLGDSVALVSAGLKIYETGLEYPNNYRTRYTDLKFDILNSSDGKKVTDTIDLKDIYEEGYMITGTTNSIWTNKYVSDGKIMFSFACERRPSLENGDASYMAYYEVIMNGNAASSEVYIWNSINSPAPSAEYEGLDSESGRYKSLYKNNDLYIRDNDAGTDILVFDSKPDNETEETDIGEYIYAGAAFFEGDTLYYHLTGYEWFIGSGYYNAETGEKGEFRNGIRLSAKLGDRFFGSTSILDSELYYGVFTADAPDKAIRLPFTAEELERSLIQVTGDGKLIKMTEPKGSTGNTGKWREDVSTLTVYDAETLELIKDYTMESPYEYMQHFVVTNGYVWIITSGGTILITKY